MNPLTLRIKNFFSHEESEVSFDFKSCLLIGNTEGDYSKSNGSGKSSIFEALLWALFNKSRAPKVSDLVRWGENSASVELEFETDGELYLVKRDRNNKNRVSSVNFYKRVEDKWVDCSGSTPSLTNDIIEKTIRLDYKTFLNTTYFRQNDASEFAESEPYRRKEILKSIVDIAKWDSWEDKSKDKIRTLKAEIKTLELKSSEAEDLSQKKELEMDLLEKCSREIKRVEHTLSTEEDSYQVFLQELLTLKSNLDFSSMDTTEQKIKEINSNLGLKSKHLLKINDDISKAKSGIEKCSTGISKIEKFLSGKRIVEVKNEDVSLVSENISNLKSNIKYCDKMIQNLQSKSIDSGECEMCGSDISHSHVEFFNKKRDDEISHLRKEKNDSNEKLKLMLLNLKDMEETLNLNKKISDAIDKKSFAEERVSALISDLERSTEEKKSIETLIFDLEKELVIHEEKLSSLKDSSYEDCEVKVKKKRSTIERIREELFLKKKEIGVHEANLKQYSERLDSLSKVREQLDLKRVEMEDYTYLKNVFGKGGIQTILLENVIKNHQAIANSVLSEICNEPIQIHMDTQKTSADGTRTLETLDLKIRKDGNMLSYDSLSGGEKFRISIALALGLRDLAARFGGANLNLIMLDEVNSPLDRYGVETLFVNVIEKISERYKTMVITHDESLKEKFENVIDVCKINGVSTIDSNLNNLSDVFEEEEA